MEFSYSRLLGDLRKNLDTKETVKEPNKITKNINTVQRQLRNPPLKKKRVIIQGQKSFLEFRNAIIKNRHELEKFTDTKNPSTCGRGRCYPTSKLGPLAPRSVGPVASPSSCARCLPEQLGPLPPRSARLVALLCKAKFNVERATSFPVF